MSMRRLFRSRPLFASLPALGFLLACGGGMQDVRPPKLNRFGHELGPARPVAPWVDRAPESTRERYIAVGFSKPTFWPQDALNNASEDARGKLALSLSSHIEVLGQSTQSSGSNAGHDRSLDLTKEATDLVVQNSRIVETWTDEAGVRDEMGAVWAMAVIELAVGGGAVPGSLANDTNVKNANKMPGWLDRLPSSPGRIYAAGYSGPTFQAGDSLQYAGDSAVQNLAASLRSHVQAYALIVQTQSGMSVDDFAHIDDPDAAFLELVRKNAQVEQVWVDEDGARAGDPPGAVWALAGIDAGSGKGGYEKQQNDALGPALDAHGNISKNVKDTPAPSLSAQVAAHAQQAQAAEAQKAAQMKARIDAHNAEVQGAVKKEQDEYRKGTAQAPASPAVVPLNGGGPQPAPK
jgi:hypothetical protein